MKHSLKTRTETEGSVACVRLSESVPSGRVNIELEVLVRSLQIVPSEQASELQPNNTCDGTKSLLTSFVETNNLTHFVREVVSDGDFRIVGGEVWVDAGVRGNGTTHADGRFAIVDSAGVVAYGPLGKVTNNEAELMVIQILLDVAVAVDRPITVYSDSQLAVNMVNRVWRGKEPRLRALVRDIQLPENVRLLWTPRDENRAGHFLETAYSV